MATTTAWNNGTHAVIPAIMSTDDPEPTPLPEEVLSTDGIFVVGLRQGDEFTLVDSDGCSFMWDQELGDLDLAARFVSQSDAADAAMERGMTVLEIVQMEHQLQLRAVD